MSKAPERNDAKLNSPKVPETTESVPSPSEPDPKEDLKAQMEALADIATTAYAKGWCGSGPVDFDDVELSEEDRQHLDNLLSRND
jgi:hypothetical protein